MEIYEAFILYPGMWGLGIYRSPLGYKSGRRVNYYAIRFYSIVGSDNHWSPDDFARCRI